MKIAVSMKNDSDYAALKNRLNNFEEFRFSESRRFTLFPCNGDFQELADRVTYGNMDLVVADKRLSYFHRVEAMCEQFDVELIGFQDDMDSVIAEVDMAGSFLIDEAPGNHLASNIRDEEPNQPQKEVVVKIGEKVIEREVEKLRYTHIPPKILVFGSLWPGAGSTLYSTNLARAVAERKIDVSYIEYPKMKPYTFDYMNVARLEKELNAPYIDYAKKLYRLSNVPKVKGFRYKGVQWVLNDSRHSPVPQWSSEDMLKLIHSLRDTPILIVDVSSHWNEPAVSEFLQHVDHIYVCVEPDPVKIDWTSTVQDDEQKSSRVLNEYRTVQLLQAMGQEENISFDYIEMKMNQNVPLNTWHDCLEKIPISSFPAIPLENLSTCMWESKFLYDDPRYQTTFEKSFYPVIQSLLPKNYQHLKGHKRSGLKKWFKRGHVQ
ncbi:MAG TPA: hypothetical protein VFT51_10455 [Bacillales bacterium]|nr:hypothetical protein [Bacillales bacterium]